MRPGEIGVKTANRYQFVTHCVTFLRKRRFVTRRVTFLPSEKVGVRNIKHPHVFNIGEREPLAKLALKTRRD